MPNNTPKAVAQDLALISGAWKSRVFFYMSELHTLEQISEPSYFEQCKSVILPGNFVYINDKDGRVAIRAFSITKPDEDLDKLEKKRFKAEIHLVKPE